MRFLPAHYPFKNGSGVRHKDGFQFGPDRAAEVPSTIARAAAGDPHALARRHGAFYTGI